MTVKLFAMAASFRLASFNKKLLTVAVGMARAAGAEVDHADFREFEMPLYDADLQASSGLPKGALELIRRTEAVDGLLIASPEYNYSLPGTLKNAIDWVSRSRPMPTRGKSAFLMAASNGRYGGIRGLWQLRIPLEGIGILVYPDMFALSEAGAAFAEDGSLKDPIVAERLRNLVGRYLEAASALAGLGRGA
jgi:NAD(P)H-dependent FMN reductase